MGSAGEKIGERRKEADEKAVTLVGWLWADLILGPGTLESFRWVLKSQYGIAALHMDGTLDRVRLIE